MRKNHLKIICEIANLKHDERAHIVRIVAAAEEIPTDNDSAFCRTWVINVLRSLRQNGVDLYGQPEAIQKAAQRAAGEFDMQHVVGYHVVAPATRPEQEQELLSLAGPEASPGMA
ncbi:hypothetical protein SAMD00023353_3500610 [Rosellinia necatrix]|uniref:Uncharacterized protein n=1 Tax=Rosellinia necatrix TaxID=77044 RepID=A0A1W2TMS4_ROSNE|nr:hypothetical protein SAMD00023353_3500610 [Rosellinia necatrix]